MDFGFRAHLWGEEIRSTQLIRLSYNGEVPPQDSTVDENHLRFYLKNILPVFSGDAAHIPLRFFPGYFFHSGEDPFQAWDDFSDVRRWVKENKFRFRRDSRSLMDLWEYPENRLAEPLGKEKSVPEEQPEAKKPQFRMGSPGLPKTREKP
jgi:hypothetical protein